MPDTRYRLDVIAPNVLDVVKSAGGWLFDHSMAGWDVTVMVCASGDFRPLHILGADALELTSTTWEQRPYPHNLAVAAELLHCDESVRHAVLRAFEHGLGEVTLWGEPWPEELHRIIGGARHRLSRAARVFKAQALGAACDPSSTAVADAEAFQCGTVVRSLARLDPRIS
ncbi:hypothetical protein [Mycobacterium sp. DL440]|uniref:hypothetical protein n=1 Tax=Mycobacterium sp. DL440 TaxID=2675523 RepID=UPI001422D65A|nr:hypothetical protein [Mycobacterium sp. DL440]